MQLRMWTYDIAREQSPTYEYLHRLCKLTLESGYNAIGLYLEHRFAYPSAPWVAGKNALTPDVVTQLQKDFPDLQIIPFINLLGHFEGFMYSEEGAQFACERFTGLQADPTNSGFVGLCEKLIDDVVKIFTSDLIHIGGDETQQLGKGRSAESVSKFESEGATDGKAILYGQHFGPLAERIKSHGRNPGVWGDMFFEHPDALHFLPKDTVIFDWQYFKSAEHTSKMFLEKGYQTVFCPAIHTYNSVWCHLPQSERNVAENAEAAERLGAYGVCVTTWELGLMGNYNTILPAIEASGRILEAATIGVDQAQPLLDGTRDEDIAIYADTESAPRFLASYLKHSETSEEWARLMGVELNKILGFTGIRSSMKCRMLLYSNPFLLYLRDRDFLLSEAGNQAFELCERAMAFAQNPDERSVTQFAKKSIEFVRLTARAHVAYANRKPGEAIVQLSPCRQVFEDLERAAKATELNSCGSKADVHRCVAAKKHVEEVIHRIKIYGDGSLGYLPSFETISHPKFMPHDQANWWLINKWANE
jgi:hypothetical protein